MPGNTNTSALAVGEKYLSISVLGQIKLAAFPNKNKKDAKSPDFVGNGVAVWVNQKREAKAQAVAAQAAL